jgi:hypothetical protein
MREVEAEHRPYSSAELATAEKLRRRVIAGSKKQIAARLSQLAKDLSSTKWWWLHGLTIRLRAIVLMNC